MKKFLILSILLISINVSAKPSMQDSDKGNGGSSNEASLVLYEELYKHVATKIKFFFINDQESLQQIFPEFMIDDLLANIDKTKIEVVTEKLFDDEGAEKGCLKKADTSTMICNKKWVILIYDNPKVFFISVLHDYLELMGLEKNISIYSNYATDFPISSRVEPYIKIGIHKDLLPYQKYLIPLKESMHMEIVSSEIGNVENMTDKELQDKAKKISKKRCKAEKKKLTYSDARLLDIKLGTVLIRYICD